MKKLEENIFEIEKNDICDFFNFRDKDCNKGDFGTVGIMGGCVEYSGAVKLANMSSVALRAGCGIARVIIPNSIKDSVSPFLLEQTLFLMDSDENGHMIMDKEKIKEALNKLNALLIGIGWGNGKDNTKILQEVFSSFDKTIIIDADGLNTLSKMDMNILSRAKGKIVLTPHLKEFERLSKVSIDEIKKNNINLAIEFAKKYNVILLLKGATTVVTDGNLTYLVNRGCPGMATAGSGDVLSGILVGMLGYNDASALSVAAGAYLAGIAGEFAQEEYTDIAMKSSDTIKYIPNAIRYIRDSK